MVDAAARRKAWLDVPDDPPDDRPELSAGSLPGGAVMVHETGDPDTFIMSEDAVAAPDFETE